MNECFLPNTVLSAVIRILNKFSLLVPVLRKTRLKSPVFKAKNEWQKINDDTELNLVTPRSFLKQTWRNLAIINSSYCIF